MDTNQVCKILLVDDHPIVRRGLKHLINKETDLKVCGEAGTSDEAIAKIQQEHPDLAIIDIILPNSSGLDLIRQISRTEKKLPIVVVSAHHESVYAERSLRAGAMGYVMKDQAEQQIIAAIRQVLDGNVYVSKKITHQLIKELSKPQSAETSDKVRMLSDREFEIFRLLGEGMETKEIAAQLCVSPKTIDSFRLRIKTKLGIQKNAELIKQAVTWFLKPQSDDNHTHR